MAADLSDSDIASQLHELGQDIGPVNATTRRVYERKLRRLSRGLPTADRTALEKSEKTQEVTGTSQLEDSSLDVEQIVWLGASTDDFTGSLVLEDDDGDGVDDLNRDWNRFSRAEPVDTNIDGLSEAPSQFGKQDLVSTVPVLAEEYELDKHGSISPVVALKNCSKALPYEEEKQDPTQVSGTVFRKQIRNYSPAPLAQRNMFGIKGDSSSDFLRQRIVTENQGFTTYERSELKPEDCILSPRSPLSTYRHYATPTRSMEPSAAGRRSAPPVIWKASQPVKPRVGRGCWIVAACVTVLLALLFLLMLINMEPGYKHPF